MGIFSKVKQEKSENKELKYTIKDEILNTLDPSIRPLIKLCNENGIITFACCSGDVTEHLEPENAGSRGYLAFQDSPEARSIVANLLEYEDLNISISSAPTEPHEYFGQVIDKETFAIYFKNEYGENMKNIYERFDTAIKQKSAPSKNLKMINTLIKKFREQNNEFEYSVEFNDISNREANLKCGVWIKGTPLLDDEKNVGNVELLSKDISHLLGTSDRCSDIGLMYVPESMGKNALPVIDLIKKQALSNKERYSLSRDEIRKKYGEVYDEQDFEYLGYEEEYKASDDFENELDEMFPSVSLERLNYIFDELSDETEKNDIGDDDDFVF